LSSILATVKPSLAILYERANRKVFNTHYYVVKSEYKRFIDFSLKLRNLGIPERDYAFGIVTLLKSWAKAKKFGNVPVNVFCGEWALGRYTKIHNQEYVKAVDTMDDEQIVLQGELIVAKYYINTLNSGDFTKFSYMLEEIKGLLPAEWLLVYRLHTRRPITEVIDLLCEEYGIGNAVSYEDIARKLRCKA